MSYDRFGFKISKTGRLEEPGETGAKIGAALRYFVDNYWPSIRDWIDAKDGRSKFTYATVECLWNQEGPWTAAGYIITDVDYRTSEEVHSWKIEYYGQFPFAQWEYTILAFPNDRETSFTLLGDGGYLNWAVRGNFTSEDGSPDVYFHETEWSKENKKRDQELREREQEERAREEQIRREEQRIEQEKEEEEAEEEERKEYHDDQIWKEHHGGHVGRF